MSYSSLRYTFPARDCAHEAHCPLAKYNTLENHALHADKHEYRYLIQ